MNVFLSVLLRENNITEAEALFESMATSGQMDLYSVNIMLTRYASQHDVQRAKRVWAQWEGCRSNEERIRRSGESHLMDTINEVEESMSAPDDDGEDIARSLMVRCLCSSGASVEDLSRAVNIALEHPERPVVSALMIGLGTHRVSPSSAVDTMYELVALRFEEWKETQANQRHLANTTLFAGANPGNSQQQWQRRILDLEATLEVALSSLLTGYSSIHRNDLCIAAYMRAYDVFDPLILRLRLASQATLPAVGVRTPDNLFRSRNGVGRLPEWPLIATPVRRLGMHVHS